MLYLSKCDMEKWIMKAMARDSNRTVIYHHYTCIIVILTHVIVLYTCKKQNKTKQNKQTNKPTSKN